MTRSFTAGHSVVKLEHVIVVGCDAPNVVMSQPMTNAKRSDGSSENCDT